MSWDGNIFSWSSLSSSSEEGSQPSTLTDSSTNSMNPVYEAPYDGNNLSLTPSQESVNSEDLDEWELRLSDSSDESPEEASQDNDTFLEQVPSDQSLWMSPNDATPPQRSPEFEPEPGSSQEQSSLESRDGDEWSQEGNYDTQSQERSHRDGYDYQGYRREEMRDYDDQENTEENTGYVAQEQYEDFESDGRGRFIRQRSSSRRRSSSGKAFADGNEQRSIEKRKRSSKRDGSEMEFENEEWKRNPRKKRKTSKRKRTAKNKHSDENLQKKKRRSSENESHGGHDSSDPPSTGYGSFEEEISCERLIGTKRKTRAKSAHNYSKVEEEPSVEFSPDIEELERLYEAEEEYVAPPSRKKRRYTAARLREINENWNKMYASDLSPQSPGSYPEQLPDSAALNIKFALEECLADIQRTITTRIPRALHAIQSKEKLHKFHEDVGKDLTAIYKAVESKAVTHIQKLKENTARLADLDKILMPTESMQTTLDELRAAANDTVVSIERLRSKKEHSAVQRSLLESHWGVYQKVSEENHARNACHEAELAELEQNCAQLEEVVEKAIKLREEDKGAGTFTQNLQTVLETKDVLQKELESLREQISQQEDIISFPDRLKVEKILVALREMTSALLSARGVSDSIDFDAEPSLPENCDNVLEIQESIEHLEDLFKSLSSTSSSAQTILTMQHVSELENDLEILDEPQDSSATDEHYVTGEKSQSSSEADSSAALD